MKNLFILLITITMILTACQPTPNEEIVVGKDKDLVEEVIEANKEENKEKLQEDKEVIEQQIKVMGQHLNMEFQTSSRTKVVVDAEVRIPNFDKIPLVRVIPENLTKEHLEILLRETTNGKPVYYQPKGNRSSWTKEELDEMIVKYKEMEKNPDLAKHIIGHISDRIDFLQEIYNISPNKGEEELYDGTLTETDNNKYYSHITSLKCYLGRNCAARIELCQSFNKRKNQITLRNHDDGVPYNSSIPYEGVNAPNMEMTYDEAKQIVEDLVKALDGEQTNLKLYYSGIAYIEGGFSNGNYETSPHAYRFGFAREYNGVSVKPIGYLHGGSEKINYRDQVSPEVMSITIDDGGLLNFTWLRYTRYKETLTEDVPLLDFETVRQTFEDNMKYKFAWEPTFDNIPKDATTTITIHTVELNLMMTLEKDNMGNYIMIPVWDFVGDQEYDQELISHEGYPQLGQKNVAVLTINAIDGTVINREQGY